MHERAFLVQRETSSSDNEIPESILDLGRRLVLGDLDPEESLRAVWRLSFAETGNITPSERSNGLRYLQGLFPPNILVEFLRPIGPQGKTRLAQIAAQEVQAANEVAKERELMARRMTRKKPSRGYARHISKAKARAQREGKPPLNF